MRISDWSSDVCSSDLLLSERAEVEGLTPAAWRDRMLAALSAMPNVTVMNRTMAFGFYDHQLVGLCERVTDHLPPSRRSGPRQRLWKVRTKDRKSTRLNPSH